MKYYILILYYLTKSTCSFCQVSVLPFLDLSYKPYELKGANAGFTSNKIDIGFGFAALLPVSKSYSVLTRFSYYKRSGGNWTDCSFTHCTPSNYDHSDLNVQFAVMRKIWNKLSLGLGPTLSKKVNSSISVENFLNDGNDKIFSLSNFNIFLNGNILYLSLIHI